MRKQPSWYFVTGSSKDQIISVITELKNNVRETNIKYYFTFTFVIHKYTNSDIMIIPKLVLSKIDKSESKKKCNHKI